MKTSRFIVGLILVVAAALLFLWGQGAYATSGAIALGVPGLVSIAISRRQRYF
jgi:uncharacterized membrane protein